MSRSPRVRAALVLATMALTSSMGCVAAQANTSQTSAATVAFTNLTVQAAPTFNADGVALTAPRVVAETSTSATLEWTVRTNKSVTFKNLQIASTAGDAGWAPGTTVNGSKTFKTTVKRVDGASYRVAYELSGKPWVNGPAVKIGAPAPEPAPIPEPTPTPEPPASTVSYNAAGVALSAPKVVSTTESGTTLEWTVRTNKAVTFQNLQLASSSGDAGWAPNTTVNGSKTFTTKVNPGGGTHAYGVAYQLAGTWVNGGTVSFTQPGATAAPAPTPTPAPTTPSPTSRPSGLAFDSGVFASHNASRATQLERMRGAKNDVIAVFPTRDSWGSLQNTWWMDSPVPPNYKGTLAVAMPMWPKNGNVHTAAAGGYNEEWRKFGATLAAKYPDAYVRIGWEMNLNNSWAATPSNQAQWTEAFRQASTSLKKGGPNLRVVFNPNEGRSQTGLEADKVWPGNAYVDVVGIDAYDWYPAYDSDADWKHHRDQAYGWNWWLNFGKARGKTFSVPEWGLVKGYSGGGTQGGDNPKYINYVYQWMSDNRDHMAFEAYFDDPDAYLQSSFVSGQHPTSARTYANWMTKLD